MEYINEYLPEDIAVLSCEVAPERFHSRLSAVRKTYCYQLEMGPKKMFSEKLLLWSGRTVGCFCHEGSSRSSYRNP